MTELDLSPGRLGLLNFLTTDTVPYSEESMGVEICLQVDLEPWTDYSFQHFPYCID